MRPEASWTIPRCLLARRNRSFKDSLPETKWFYLEKRSSGIMRKVAMFAQGVYRSKKVQAAIADYIKNYMKDI